jgi:hypothetical protein
VLNDVRDRTVWSWNNNRKISVKPVYNFLSRDECGDAYDSIWKAKVLEKIRIFMWLAI